MGAPSLKILRKVWIAICLWWYKDYCIGQGVGQEDLQDPFQPYDSILMNAFYCQIYIVLYVVLIKLNIVIWNGSFYALLTSPISLLLIILMCSALNTFVIHEPQQLHFV